MHLRSSVHMRLGKTVYIISTAGATMLLRSLVTKRLKSIPCPHIKSSGYAFQQSTYYSFFSVSKNHEMLGHLMVARAP